ncbi:YlbF family regulator [Gracilibacillus marinus]|jgi:cell fate (sporulation/competence/biofilm development) regulator YlbF (YheA/YmcA/DUF963 family)|uniref:UPF0342 protein ACFOZ1_12715 n=1 Tax=Gracilibacillus marinus TaxID=630535 RepID=A0ABV8VY92_9BACI
MSNIQESAHQLEVAIQESDEFKDLKAAYEKVMNEPSSREMFDNFRNVQLELQQKQMQGLEITEEEVEKAKSVVELVQQHEDISKLMEQEQRVNMLINDISRTITKPLEELYSAE